MIVTATKYCRARGGGKTPSPQAAAPRAGKSGPPKGGTLTAPHLFVPKAGAMVGLEEYFWRELREGGVLHEYLRREKGRTRERYRQVARATRDFKQNNKSDMRVKAQIPLRDFMRWRRIDPDFWRDDKNLRSLKRDNEDCGVRVYV